jgi:hypothetical protein
MARCWQTPAIMRRAVFIPALVAALLCSHAARAQTTPAADALARVLPLCGSPDPASRRFCVQEIRSLRDPERRAHARLMEMAASDDEAGGLAADAIRDLYGEPPPMRVTSAASRPAGRWPVDPGSTRTIFMPTAFTRPRGNAAWTIFDAGHWTFDYGATDELELGVQTGPPIGAFLVAPQIKVAAHAPSASLALFAFGGAFMPVIGNADSILFYGGGPIVTVGDPDHFASFGMQVYALSASDSTAAFLLPNAGGSARLSRRLRASVEILVPDAVGAEIGDELDPGDLIVVLYGVRIVGSQVWGDIAFAYPVCSECGDVTQALPLGLPLLGIGLSW